MKTAELSTLTFQNDNLRVINKPNNDIFFVAKDVCDALGTDIRHIYRVLDKEDISLELVQTSGGMQNMTVISESAFYTLVFRSRKPKAKAFQKWVAKEVLPKIINEGVYNASESKTEIPLPKQ
jgi:anti-repressor protein